MKNILLLFSIVFLSIGGAWFVDNHVNNLRIERCATSIDNEVTVYGRVYTCGRYL